MNQRVASLLKEESWEHAMFVEVTGAPTVPGWFLCIPVIVWQSEQVELYQRISWCNTAENQCRVQSRCASSNAQEV